jgi:hypothetical protein
LTNETKNKNGSSNNKEEADPPKNAIFELDEDPVAGGFQIEDEYTQDGEVTKLKNDDS